MYRIPVKEVLTSDADSRYCILLAGHEHFIVSNTCTMELTFQFIQIHISYHIFRPLANGICTPDITCSSVDMITIGCLQTI